MSVRVLVCHTCLSSWPCAFPLCFSPLRLLPQSRQHCFLPGLSDLLVLIPSSCLLWKQKPTCIKTSQCLKGSVHRTLVARDWTLASETEVKCQPNLHPWLPPSRHAPQGLPPQLLRLDSSALLSSSPRGTWGSCLFSWAVFSGKLSLLPQFDTF